MKIIQIRTFVPSKDFEVSKQFYQDLGLDILWQNEELAEIGTPEQNFFLQKYYVEEWANNFMLQMFVDDLDALYAKAKTLIERYEGTKIRDIFEADYGKTFHLIGPAGELWHLTETKDKSKNQRELICDE